MSLVAIFLWVIHLAFVRTSPIFDSLAGINTPLPPIGGGFLASIPVIRDLPGAPATGDQQVSLDDYHCKVRTDTVLKCFGTGGTVCSPSRFLSLS